ncbi:MAG: hypothetical protein Phog2KO_39210 [Phototrophicaceae bacterium]
MFIEVDTIPVGETIKNGTLFTIVESNNTTYSSHGIHKFPGKFIPHIPRWAIQQYVGQKEGSNILDPFCGSGTTMLEALLLGHNAYGLDVDPLARLISKVKTTPISCTDLDTIVETIREKINKKTSGNFLPDIDNLDHWFTPENTRQLSIIRDVIDEFKSDQTIYQFLLVIFSSILRRVSNADDQSQKTYVSHTRPKTPPEAFETFFKALERRVKAIKTLVGNISEDVSLHIPSNMSALDFDFGFKFDLAITSPPYIKSIDYIYNQMVEYFWIGDVWGLQTQANQREYKQHFIGTERVKSGSCTYTFDYLPELEKKLIDIKKKHKKLETVTRKFFFDMEKHFQLMWNNMKPGSHYIMVIGNSRIAGQEVPTHQFLGRIAEYSGFTISNVFGYRIRRHYMKFPRAGRGGIILIDWILDLQKPSNGQLTLPRAAIIPKSIRDTGDGGGAIVASTNKYDK